MHDGISSLLRQSPPFRYIDDLLNVDVLSRSGRMALALGAGSGLHFDCQHELPAYLLLEAMAQACSLLVTSLTVGEVGWMLVGIEDAVISHVLPLPAKLVLEVRFTQCVPPIFGLFVNVLVQESSIATANIQVMSRREFHVGD